jgi:hypothetical protein
MLGSQVWYIRIRTQLLARNCTGHSLRGMRRGPEELLYRDVARKL